VKALSPAQILERLDQSLPLLTGGARDGPERQRTLRATIGWSYELLSPEEQRLFRALAVFVGGFAVEAAERVAGADLDLLQSLVDKSLLRFDGERYAMLETIREFATERLEAEGESGAVRRAHAEFFVALGESEAMSAEHDYGFRYDVFPPERENLRAAIDWLASAGETELALQLAISLENFWVITDPFEGIRTYERLLAQEGVPELLRAPALRCYAGSSFLAGKYEQAQEANEKSLALFRAADDDAGIAELLHRIGINALMLGEPERARQLLEQSVERFRALGSARGEAEGIGALGYVLHAEGNFEGALRLFRTSAEMCAEIGFTWWRQSMLAYASECEFELGRIDESERTCREELELAREMGDRQAMVYGLAHLARTSAVKRRPARAGRLWGALEAEAERAPLGQWELEKEEYANGVLVAHGAEFDLAYAQGRALAFDAAIDEALAGAAGAPKVESNRHPTR
jgi:tetratricopeptide (TPR) repeat protein